MTMKAQLDGESNILLKVPPMGDSRDTGTSLLLDGIEDASVLFVSYTQPARNCVELVVDRDVRNAGVVTIGDTSTAVDHEGVVTENVSTPSDLTGLGIQIGEFLSEWEPPVIISFDSLTSMLQYVDFETAYEFLHAVTGQVHAANARAGFYIDPDAHDEQWVAGITSLFDASVDVGAEVVRTRELIE